MNEILISKENGISYFRENGTNIFVKNLPSNIQLLIDDLFTYCAQLKSEDELAKEALYSFIKVNATDNEKLTMTLAFPMWESGRAYNIGDEFNYLSQLYRVVQAHISQSGWTPDIVPALYTKIAPAGVIPDWVQPTGAQDAYQIDDQVRFEGLVYKSLIDANVWSPTAYPAGWQLVS